MNPPAHKRTLGYDCTLCLLLAVVVMATAGCHSTRPQAAFRTSLKPNEFNAIMARMEKAARLEPVPLARVGEPMPPPVAPAREPEKPKASLAPAPRLVAQTAPTPSSKDPSASEPQHQTEALAAETPKPASEDHSESASPKFVAQSIPTVALASGAWPFSDVLVSIPLVAAVLWRRFRLFSCRLLEQLGVACWRMASRLAVRKPVARSSASASAAVKAAVRAPTPKRASRR